MGHRTLLSMLLVVLGPSTGLALSVTGCDRDDEPRPSPEPATPADTTPADTTPAGAGDGPGSDASTCNCARANECDDCVELTYEIPKQLECSTQAGADCAAWKTFIALNWPADPTRRGEPDKDAKPAVFGDPGTPGQLTPVVWTTYMDTSQIFRAGAKPPPGWDDPPQEPNCALPAGKSRGFAPQVVSDNFGYRQALQPGRTVQADGHWLADQDGKLVFYEVKLDEKYYDYVTSNKLYVPGKQWAISISDKAGVTPPLGAMELKSSWRQITDPALYGRYLMVDACIPKAGGGSEPATLGLVGLHIVYKLENQPNWLWSTFEHVDNAPYLANGKPTTSPPPSGWSFYDPDCKSFTVDQACVPPGASNEVLCSKDDGREPATPLYELQRWFEGVAPKCGPYRNQIWRLTSIPSCTTGGADCNPSQQVTAKAKATIMAANEDSVFQYYELISALWWTTGTPNNMKGGDSQPLSKNGLQIVPDEAGPLANTTLESYEQTADCLDCHKTAPVSTGGQVGCSSDAPAGCTSAPGGPACGTGLCAAGYSFVFDDARPAG